jgi:hypothetical protein
VSADDQAAHERQKRIAGEIASESQIFALRMRLVAAVEQMDRLIADADIRRGDTTVTREVARRFVGGLKQELGLVRDVPTRAGQDDIVQLKRAYTERSLSKDEATS